MHVLSGNPNHLYGAALLQSAIQLKAISSVRPSVTRLFAFENCVKTAKRVVKLLLDLSCCRRTTLEDMRIVNRTGATRRICISLYFVVKTIRRSRQRALNDKSIYSDVRRRYGRHWRRQLWGTGARAPPQLPVSYFGDHSLYIL